MQSSVMGVQRSYLYWRYIWVQNICHFSINQQHVFCRIIVNVNFSVFHWSTRQGVSGDPTSHESFVAHLGRNFEHFPRSDILNSTSGFLINSFLNPQVVCTGAALRNGDTCNFLILKIVSRMSHGAISGLLQANRGPDMVPWAIWNS